MIYNAINKTKKVTIAISFIVAVIMIIFYLAGGKEFIYNQIVNPLQFKLRNKLNYAPELHPDIKIFAVDQKTMNKVDLENIPIENWIKLFKAVASAKPKAVFIDKVFALPLSSNEKKVKELKDIIAGLNNTTASSILSKNELNSFNPMSGKYLISSTEEINDPTSYYVYGPREPLSEAFTNIGYTNYEDNGEIRPISKTITGKLTSYWSLYAGQVEIKNSSVFINGQDIYLDENNKILVNYSAPETYWKKTYSLVNLINKSQTEALNEISSSDIVVILTAMFQGTTVYKNTPTGNIPGGFTMVSVLNSVVSSNWLRYVKYEVYLIPLFCLLGFLISYYASLKNSLIILFSFAVAIIFCGFYAFCIHSLRLPWAFSTLSLLATGLVIYFEKSRALEKKSKAIQFSLEGMVDANKLKTILENAETFKIEPKKQVLTVMFIDIVGFSTLAEKQNPEEVFTQLKQLMSLITENVHYYDGVVDRSLGDGLLCFFGYKFDDSSLNNDDHITQAIKCSLDIQKQILERDHNSMNSGGVVFPLRIGLNTGEVYIGDLGGKGKIDFTVIGHTVNLAQRMESACENYRVLCGKNTHDMLSGENRNKYHFDRKFVKIKHHDEPVESYELDPFRYSLQQVEQRAAVFNYIKNKTRIQPRFNPQQEMYIQIKGEWGTAKITNVSETGLQIICGAYFGKGIELNFKFDVQSADLNETLNNMFPEGLTVEVMWASKINETSHITGLMLKNLSQKQKSELHQVLMPYLKNN